MYYLVLLKSLASGLLLCLLTFSATADTITYEIFSYKRDPNGVLLAQGSRQYSVADIEVVEKGYRDTYWEKSIELEDGFKLGASIYRKPAINSLGLWIRYGACGYSWEKFIAHEPGEFRKALETGDLSVEYFAIDGMTEVSAIHFDSDIILKLDKTGNEIGRITHRVLIKKGSVLRFARGNNPPQQPVTALSCE